MAYVVNIAVRAEREFGSLYREINAEESDADLKWYRGLKMAVLSLEELPNRCPLTREKGQVRHLPYGNKPHVYRVIFRVVEKQKRVDVLHIRHGARDKLKASEVG